MERALNGPDRELLTAKEAADWLNLPESTWDNLVEAGAIPAGLPLSQRTVRWTWEMVLGIKLLLPHLLGLLPKLSRENPRER